MRRFARVAMLVLVTCLVGAVALGDEPVPVAAQEPVGQEEFVQAKNPIQSPQPGTEHKLEKYQRSSKQSHDLTSRNEQRGSPAVLGDFTRMHP